MMKGETNGDVGMLVCDSVGGASDRHTTEAGLIP